MAGWHHWLDGCESEWTPGVRGGQWGLVCCSSWGCKESDTTERLNWTDSFKIYGNSPAADTSEFYQQYDKYNTKLNSSGIEGQIQFREGQLIYVEGIIC